MPDGASLETALRLPPGKAMEFFKQKLNVPSLHWDDLWHEAHARGFMVAGATSQALLGDLRKAVDQAISGGVTAAGFRKEFDAIVAKHGWSHTGSAAWRSDIIYSTNMLTAHSAGRYARQTTPEALEMFPYWQYEHHTCQHPRLQHIAWNGLVLRADNAWWNTHYPPNGWRCHCTVRILSERMMKRLGLEVSTAPPLNALPWHNKRTGETLYVPEGIDPGFAYNPGKAWQQGVMPPIGSRFKAEDAGPVASPEGATTQRPAAPKAAPEQTSLVHVPDEHRDRARQEDILKLRHAKPGSISTVNAGTIPDVMRTALGADTATVRLSDWTMQKQERHHPELTDDDYRVVPALLRDPALVVHSRKNHVLMLGRADRLYRAVIKTTADGAENYLQSFHRTNMKDAARSVAGAQIISGSLEALEENGGDDALGGPPGNPP